MPRNTRRSLPTVDAVVALRGPMIAWRGDPFEVGARRALLHEPDAIVAMTGGRIVHAGPASLVLRKLPPRTRVERLPRHSLMAPGFVDAHVHYPQWPMVASHGAQLLDWLANHTFPSEAAFSDSRLASRVARAYLDENLRQGITSAAVFCTVHPGSVDALMREARARGFRLIAGKVLMDRNAPRRLTDSAKRGYDESKALIARWHGRGRLGYAITPRFAVTSSPAQLEAAGALWREHPDCWVQSHVSENRGEVEWVRKLFPRARDYIDVYARFGLVGPRAIYGHGIHLAEREWRALAASGSAIAHCPTSNLFLGSGLFRWDRAKKPARPVEVGLATDVGGGTSLSILRTMGAAYQVAQLSGWSMPPVHAFWLATQGSARALGLASHIGNLAPGHEADLVVLDLASTPAIAQRMERVGGVDEALFVQMTMGDDRAIRQTWIGGRRLHDRDTAPARVR
ncbi:MAG: guanine deaminase [Burkholderiales bacterium]|nr:guanine deaminase [Burkholderiales bacterium]MCE7876113.1 guanine deaminase [Betaproteobacteria bacterium PRO3]